MTLSLPKRHGFLPFHRNSFFNYQLNRLHAEGWVPAPELFAAAREIRDKVDFVDVMERRSAWAEAAGRLREATGFARSAEFFTPHDSPDRIERYCRFRDLFDRAFPEIAATRTSVPFDDGYLPAYRLAATGASRGTVLLFGGFDSLIEEFLYIWQRIAGAGFDVIAFDGPGQGGARALGDLPFDHDWERPVGAILDHFGVERATLVGISMGGYWAIRAAAWEPRIERVVAWSPVYDWLARLPSAVQGFVRWMVGWRTFMNAGIRFRMWLFPILDHAVRQALYLIDRDQPMDAVDWLLGMNAQHGSSERVTQDVLLMAGEHDGFQPPALAHLQQTALTNARSVAMRVFTASEHADQHCQMGNLGLACDELTHWLRHGELA